MKNGKNDIVVKSNQLIEAKYKLSIREQKIILYLTSKIDVNDEEFKMYRLSIKNFCEMMGLKGSPKYTEIKDITDGLQKKLLKIKKDGKTYSVAWLSLVVYNENEGSIDMRFDPFLKPFLLQLKKEFTQFELKNVLNLKSGNSIRLYELLKQYLAIGERQISISELKEFMGIGKDGYKKYADFKRKVILVAEKEINEKTDITISFKEIKKSRSVVSLKFIIKSKKEAIEQQTLSFEEDDEWFDSLFAQLKLPFEKHGYVLSEEVVKRWIVLGEKVWGSRKYVEINKIVQSSFQKEGINNHLAFVTFILNEKVKYIEKGLDHQQASVETTKKVIRQELLPDWFIELKEEEAASKNHKNVEEKSKEDLEKKRRELEEWAKNRKNRQKVEV
ncbi:replication initiation protein [Bacillus badius]|uniref:replication initiation protein n=1 Tax=Bacillus badius TaxID=1455 RepID=UPI0007B3F84F|nr:replication initiation protein [Bacillus badius]KZR59330.1 hypothetical protein A3781_13090 [Bacillus badius]